MTFKTLPTTAILSAIALLTAAVPVRAESLIERWQRLEQNWEGQYEAFFDSDLVDRSPDFDTTIASLARLSEESQQASAILYVIPDDDRLELILATPSGDVLQEVLPDVSRDRLLTTVRAFEREIVDVRRRRSTRYLELGKQLHDWLVAPVEDHLEAEGIDTILFCFGEGLRTLPVAALHDGDRFLIESYSFSHIPGYNLLATEYRPLRDARVLAMGASEFDESHPLPGVPLELAAIVPRLWQGTTFLNEDFTLDTLQTQRERGDYDIVHLATHANFQAGNPENSYIQFWQERLSLDRIDDLQWQTPPVELLVLSACSTAQGDPQAEMGFAGLAVQSGVPSVVASLWAVSDAGTLVLMSDFYEQLKYAPTKAEALRRSQVAALRGQLQFEPPPLGDRLSPGTLVLPEGLENLETADFSHPYYWAAFATVGSPW